ncbi:hypothetical protein [Jiangella anatolica]|uniref:hypothetical protein n=1 Tax=Jiangella anatolica TaxID=2670374 RepID=UPI0013142F39|nr:hypothetical protein [Jiangella anatolica]
MMISAAVTSCRVVFGRTVVASFAGIVEPSLRAARRGGSRGHGSELTNAVTS